ncbi:halocyanin domain-containing protein [Haloprofundus halobius]|uniref:halocyanin domain-containing protein n=1 Tax=Haloprofundus halobius TaxID=2876194 RepID=UPI001CCB1003|nr:halocyanin domain-containing protein [Haloprofundus halobius]
MKRRDFLRAAGGSAAAAAAASGTAAAQEGGEEPDYGSWLSGVDGGTEDMRGESEVTVEVGADGNGGAYAFAPAGVWVDSGTTVTWEWTGEGGGHNVSVQGGPGDYTSETHSSSGATFEYTFEESGISEYQCDPHASLGMKGAVAVGDDVPTVSAGGGEKELEELGVPVQAHWVGSATILGIIVTIIYSFYILKYGESANTGRGR